MLETDLDRKIGAERALYNYDVEEALNRISKNCSRRDSNPGYRLSSILIKPF